MKHLQTTKIAKLKYHETQVQTLTHSDYNMLIFEQQEQKTSQKLKETIPTRTLYAHKIKM